MLDKPVIQQFIAQAHKRSFAPKSILLRSGDTPTCLYLILQGSVSIILEDEDGREIVLAYLGPGDFIGESGLFPNLSTRSATVRTREPVLLAESSYVAFRHFSHTHPEIMFELAGQLAARLRETGSRLKDLAFLDVAARLTHVLLKMSTQPDAGTHPQGRTVRVTRTELARNAACSREMAGRALKRLEKEGVIQVQGRRILIVQQASIGAH